MLSIDPKMAKYPGLSPYQFAANMPITLIDNEGEDFRYKIEPNGQGGGTVTIETTIHVYGANATQGLVDDLNADWAALGTSGVYVDPNGNEWKININATYVLNENLNAQAAASGQNNPSTGEYPNLDAFSDPTILPGDNVLQVDASTKFASGSTGGENKNANSALVPGRGAAKHESGHYFGLGERYVKGLDITQAGFEEDFMANRSMTEAHPLHFINMGAEIIDNAILPDGLLWTNRGEQHNSWNVVRNLSLDEGSGTSVSDKNSENSRRMQEQQDRKGSE